MLADNELSNLKSSKRPYPPDDTYGQPIGCCQSLNGKTELTELRIRTMLTAAELDAVLSKLVKGGRISIIP